MDFENIYSNYLNKKSGEYREKNKDYIDWFSASSAGSCLKKQWYKVNDIQESDPPNNESMRKMRVGTLVHEDFEKAVNYYIENKEDDNFIINTEQAVVINDLNVIGHLDCSVIHKERSEAYVWDYKTAASYSWKKTFGRNSSEFHHTNYGLQVATYAIGLTETIKTIKHYDDVEMFLIWYNKDTSQMREQRIPEYFIIDAIDYWNNAVEFIEQIKDETTIMPKLDEGIPFQSWECNYCNWKTICHQQIKGEKNE